MDFTKNGGLADALVQQIAAADLKASQLRSSGHPAQIVVPEGMIRAAEEARHTAFKGRLSVDIDVLIRAELEAACRWLSENPISPPADVIEPIYAEIVNRPTRSWEDAQAVCVEWQRRMFLAPINTQTEEEVETIGVIATYKTPCAVMVMIRVQ